jgi:sialate O-acetylesterase
MKKMSFLLLLVVMTFAAQAGIRLPAVISSNMVLQQQSHPKLWGWSDPGEWIYVTTSWDVHRTDSVKGSRDGKWEIRVPTPSAGGPYTIEIKGQSNTIRLENIMIGEVWICSGQSNMEMNETWGLPEVKDELPSCKTNNIHFFHIPRTTAVFPQDDCDGRWASCDANELKTFSAVGYFFAKKLNKELNVPVGIIEAAWGGTPAEVWTPAGRIEADADLKEGNTKLKPADGWPYLPGYCYNAMIAPVTSFELAGAIWYQGEGNVLAASTYGKLLTTMIESWRQAWNKPLPFYFVQIAPFTYGANENASLLREQQASVLKLAGTGMVVVSDITGNTTDIHPKDKHDVGERLAAWALSETYHRAGITYKNPMYRSMAVKSGKIEVDIADAPAGLVVKGGPVREVLVAGDDKVFYPAEVRIEGSRLIVSAREVKNPVAVRYQFDNAGVGNIFSKEGLPVAPFRTDNW